MGAGKCTMIAIQKRFDNTDKRGKSYE